MLNKNDLRIISIDPGNNMGIVLTTVDVNTLEIKAVETHLLILDYFNNNFQENALVNKLFSLNRFIIEIVESFQPHIMALENAFMHTRFAKAVMQLSQYISTIEIATKHVSKDILIKKYQPTVIKKTIGAGGGGDKDAVAKAINETKEYPMIDALILSEHEADALAIGYTCIQELKNNKAILHML
jgi:Holliday junction resolvasome RuvABC endonuclease subunit